MQKSTGINFQPKKGIINLKKIIKWLIGLAIAALVALAIKFEWFIVFTNWFVNTVEWLLNILSN